MPSKQAPIHKFPTRARDEQPVVATGIKVEVPEKGSVDPQPTPDTDRPSIDWPRYRPWIILIGAVTAIPILAVLYGLYSVK